MSLIPVTFFEIKLEVFTINHREWCWAKGVCKVMEYKRKRGNVIQDYWSQKNITPKYQLSNVTATGTPINWPSDLQKYDLNINEEGLFELVFNSQQFLLKAFRKHCCSVMFLHIRQQMIDKVTNEEEAITQKNNGDHEYQYIAIFGQHGYVS